MFKLIIQSAFTATLTAALLACGGGGGGGGGTSNSTSISIDPNAPSGVVDSFDTSLSNAQWESAGGGDGGAAGGDGSAGDGAPLALATITIRDANGKSVSTRTDANGYYRTILTGFVPPLIATAELGNRTRYAFSTLAPASRKYVTINITGFTEKIASDVAQAAGATGAASLTPAMVAANPQAISTSLTNLRAQLSTQLSANGLNANTFNPMTLPFRTNGTGYDAVLDTTLVVRDSTGAAVVYPNSQPPVPALNSSGIAQYIIDFNRLNATLALQSSAAFDALHDNALLHSGQNKAAYLSSFRANAVNLGANIINPKVSNCAAVAAASHTATCELKYDLKPSSGLIQYDKFTQLRQYASGWVFAGDRLATSNLPGITQVSPSLATVNQTLTLTVTGINLPSTVVLSMAGANCQTPVNVTSAGFNAVCSPQTAGSQLITISSNTSANGGSVIDASRLITVNSAQVVTPTLPPINTPTTPPINTPTVTPIPATPTISSIGQSAPAVVNKSVTLTITGSNLPATVALTMADATCQAPSAISSSGFSIVCTPVLAGTKLLTISTNTAANGGVVIDATRSISVASDVSVTSIVSTTGPASYGQPVTLLVTGTNFPPTVNAWLTGICQQAASITSTSFTVTCVPSIVGNLNIIVVRNFNLPTQSVIDASRSIFVQGNPPIATSISAAVAPTAGQAVTMTVVGSNLSSPDVLIGFQDATCDLPYNRTASSFSSVCTPLSAGLKTLGISEIINLFGVNTRYQFANSIPKISVTAAPAIATVPIPHTGLTNSQCYATGSDLLTACSSAGALALNSMQDGHRTTINALKYSQVPQVVSGLYPLSDCVKDDVTGLIWEGKTATGLRTGSNTYTNLHTSFGSTAAQMNASTNTYGYITAVNASALCGFTDWRLPTAHELHGLLNFSKPYPPGPKLDSTWFPNTPSAPYNWSSNPVVSNPANAWFVDFFYGYVFEFPRSNAYHVRLVRGAQQP